MCRLRSHLIVTALAIVLSSTANAGPLHQAVRSNDLGTVELILIDSPPTVVNQTIGPGITPLHLAAAMDRTLIAEVLIDHGADLDARTDNGFTPLHWAASRDSKDVAQLLIERGARINIEAPNGITPLHWAAHNNATNVALLLLGADADTDVQSAKGLNALHWAIKKAADEAALLLAYKMVDDKMNRELEETGTIKPLEPDRGAPPDPGLTNSAEQATQSLVSLEPLKGKPLRIPLGKSEHMTFVWIDTLGMWIGEYEVTNGQYRRFKDDHDSLFREDVTLNEDDQPAVYVSWLDAEAFCNWLNRYAGSRLPGGWHFRLPTEREWIIAARCGTSRQYPWGDEWPPAYGNYSDETARQTFPEWQGITNYTDGFAASCPVQQSGTNQWGIYGLAGNVWEWCWDWYDAEGRYKTRHGGSWDFDIRPTLEILYRGFDRPDVRYDTIGFRVVISDKSLP